MPRLRPKPKPNPVGYFDPARLRPPEADAGAVVATSTFKYNGCLIEAGRRYPLEDPVIQEIAAGGRSDLFQPANRNVKARRKEVS